MASLNLGRPFHPAAGQSLRRQLKKPPTRLTISSSSTSLLSNKVGHTLHCYSLNLQSFFNYTNFFLFGLFKQFKRAYTSVMIVPTGVGAAIGGYAGDALPVARALASVVDCLISHPNVCCSSLLVYAIKNPDFSCWEWKLMSFCLDCYVIFTSPELAVILF